MNRNPGNDGHCEGGRQSNMNRKVVAANFVIYLAVVLAIWAAPRGDFVLVLTDPLREAGYGPAVVGRAGGAFVSSGRFAWMTVAYSQDAGFPARLMQAGAVLVLNHQLALGCLKGTEE